jgi:hypothetical protein
MQELQVLQARHLFACSFSSNSNSLKVIELLATKSLPEDSLYSTSVVDTYDILPPLQHQILGVNITLGYLSSQYPSHLSAKHQSQTLSGLSTEHNTRSRYNKLLTAFKYQCL